MKKSDLKTGMLVIHRNGDRGIIMRDTEHGDCVVSNNEDISDKEYGTTWYLMRSLSSDISRDGFRNRYDIIKVYSKSNNISSASLSIDGRDLLWKRSDVSIDIDIKINGEKASLSDISEETLLSLRNG